MTYSWMAGAPQKAMAWALVAGLTTVAGGVTHADQASSPPTASTPAPSQPQNTQPAPRRYTFSWPITDDPALAPRGANSRGPEVEYDTTPSAQWKALQEPGLSQFERDRRAILAMAGGYRVTFDFLEILDFRPNPVRDRPYQSAGVEYVYVDEDRGNFISLQHLLVMRFVDKEGKVTEPMVTKHWRQDWSYEDATLVEYQGKDTWQRRSLKKGDVKGKWTQSVYQVDDSPRYESFGRWDHSPSMSTWISEDTWRPLPRREWSVRKDYDVLVGTNRHTILPAGWVQEENNLKTVLDGAGAVRASQPYLGREYGVARYQRIRNYDFSTGDKYFQRTRAFWKEVRAEWDKQATAGPRFTMNAASDQAGSFMPLFEYADGLVKEKPVNAAEQSALIKKTVDAMVK
jgi:hypothetical protein